MLDTIVDVMFMVNNSKLNDASRLKSLQVR